MAAIRRPDPAPLGLLRDRSTSVNPANLPPMDTTAFPSAESSSPPSARPFGGQPIAVLDTQRRPVAILLELNTYAEMEEAALTAGASG
jgi:hypothetical protein